ncbi:DUF4160 domain-containing protein [Nostoc sp. CHAB 5834]|nr:DUF4160 domain-containing protein [Nostoc sp. CHAB 5834]
MVTVHREAGFRFVIFKDDHEPAHVHVYYGGAEVKIALGIKRGSPENIRNYGMRMSDVRKALKMVTAQQPLLLEKWKEIHVGK